jgi:hypothetical protein
MKRYLKVFIFLFVALFSVTVYAEETNCIGGPDGTNCGDISTPIVISPPETKSTTRQFYADDTVNINEDIDNTAFIAGNDVNVDSNINGIGFIAGKNVKIKGTADYGFYAGLDVDVDDDYITDGFIAANNITLTNVDGRMIYAAASTIKIVDSSIEKLYLAGNTITLEGDFNDLVISADKVIISGTIYGTLEINEKAIIEKKGDTQIEKIVTYKEEETTKELSKGNTFAAILMTLVTGFIVNYINLAIIGAILIYACKKAFDKLAKNNNDIGYTFSKIGVGLCLLIVAPIAALILLLTGIATNLSFILIFAYIIALMITTPVVTIHYSNQFLKSINNEYLRYFVGLLIIQLAKKIPVIGGIVTFLTLCLGLGLIKDMFAKEKKEK